MLEQNHSRGGGSLLPEGWVTTKLESLTTDISYGYTASSTPEEVGPKMLRITDIQDNRVVWTDVPFCEIEVHKLDKYLLKKNDLVFARTGATVGKSFLIRNEPPRAIYASYLIRVRTASEELISHLSHFFNSQQYWQQITEFSAGIGQPNVNGTKLKGLTIPLPPLAEQKIIADKLDALLARVETTKARLECIPEILKTFRQSVLAAAVSGKLTEEWKSKSLILEDISYFQNGFAFKSGWFESEGEYQVIKLGNIRDGYLAVENSPAFLKQDVAADYLRFTPESGDTLISMTGTRFKQDYGFGCLVRNEKNLLVNQRVGRLIPNRAMVLPEYLNIYVRSELFRIQFFEGETGGVNQGNVGSKHIMNIGINLPTIEQQTEIVRKVEELFAFADSIEEKVNAALKRVNKLTQSILAKAFRGELTANWRAANPELICGKNSACLLYTSDAADE